MATEIVSIQALADDTGITTYDDGIVTYVGMKLGTAHVLSSGVNVGRAVQKAAVGAWHGQLAWLYGIKANPVGTETDDGRQLKTAVAGTIIVPHVEMVSPGEIS